MQTLGKMKFKYTSEKLKPSSHGKYLTNLLPAASNSDFFIDLYKELARIQIIVETYISDYFIRQRFDMVQKRDKQLERDVRVGRVNFTG